jgi:hypothetical protein
VERFKKQRIMLLRALTQLKSRGTRTVHSIFVCVFLPDEKCTVCLLQRKGSGDRLYECNFMCVLYGK